MRIFTLIITLIFALSSTNIADGVNYKSNIVEWSPTIQNTESNIEQAYLIERYIINYKKQIKNLADRYEIENSQILDENIEELDNMIRGLGKAQSNLVEKQDAEEIIKSVVDGLKIVNNNLKPYLKSKQLAYEKKIATIKRNYNLATQKVAAQIRIMIKRIAEPMKAKDRLSNRDKKILRHLVELEEQSKKLDGFSSKSFQSKDEMTRYLTVIVKDIRKELLGIKSLL